ncbi:histidine phosphatase family protein [Dictyobacter arantiisoli]|uniref:phosphoglycerate mutase (2,3-diphosphoglycerate-dependent) n=1 Tax=Dictyobacter arantiisoli TaxID=2014874 RepID=A0A5A5TEY0_9CHLR|nr:histidine phosphatase family protein [Dictyobacter arantiisoli]GCF09464.1 alpha-ribazole phosphatase [Dictyobacter arantiisoli]
MTSQSELTTRLLLVRHGQTEQSREDAFCGVTEVPLTAEGRIQAQKLATRLHSQTVDALYCSTQGRARETAAPIAQALELKAQECTSLREMSFGLWETRSRQDLAEHCPKELALWERGSWMVQMPDGESQQAVIARVMPCMVDLLHQYAGKTLVVVSHKSTLRLFLGQVLNMSLTASRSLRLDPASLTELHLTLDVAQLIYCNDTSHLSS